MIYIIGYLLLFSLLFYTAQGFIWSILQPFLADDMTILHIILSYLIPIVIAILIGIIVYYLLVSAKQMLKSL